MPRRVLDTSILIQFWRQKAAGRRLADISRHDAREWAAELIRIRSCQNTLTPVRLEFIAGATSSHELQLFRTFLAAFDIVDGGKILEADWRGALHRAERIPRSGSRRQLGDCLISAVAARLRYEVATLDDDFP